MATFVDFGSHNAPCLINVDRAERIEPCEEGTLIVFETSETRTTLPFSEAVQRLTAVLARERKP